MVYSAWEFEDGYGFVPGTDPPTFANGEPMPGCLRCLFTVEAGTWEEANRLYHERMGWELYRAAEG